MLIPQGNCLEQGEDMGLLPVLTLQVASLGNGYWGPLTDASQSWNILLCLMGYYMFRDNTLKKIQYGPKDSQALHLVFSGRRNKQPKMEERLSMQHLPGEGCWSLMLCWPKGRPRPTQLSLHVLTLEPHFL